MIRTRPLRAAVSLLAAGFLTAGLCVPAFAGPTADDDPGQRALTSGRPLTGWRIALDPGHNGGNAANPQAIGQLVADGRGSTKPCNTVGTETASGYPEHAFTFDVATRLAERLESLGAVVIMTRNDDTSVGPCVDVRGRFAEDVDADLMISIHANGSPSATPEGFFAIVSEPAVSPSQEAPSLELADELIASLAEGGFTPSTTVENALSFRSDLATLNFARRPTVLLELGEMRNPDEAAVMESAEGRQAYATAISAGVLEWTQDRSPQD